MSKPTPSLWLAEMPLVLASGSTTRRDMLWAAGIPVETVKPDIDEREVEQPLRSEGASEDAIAAALACAKALAVSLAHPSRYVLGADQTLACDGVAHHKPADLAAATRQLALLSGREHQLHSAFVLIRDGEIISEGLQSATLSMRPLTEAYISAYVATAGSAILSSVGGYQLEGLGIQLFERVEGDHFTILGLPLLAVLEALREQGLLLA